MKKIGIIFLILITSIFLTSCGEKNDIYVDNIDNIDNETSVEENIKEDFETIDITTKSKIDYNCDEMGENCNVSIDFGDYGVFDIGNYYMIDSKGLGKVIYNSKYNIILASYEISHAGSLGITDSVKIDLNTKKVEKFEKTLGAYFYFKDIDTIIPKYQAISEGSYESHEEEGREIKLGGEKNNSENDLSGKEFIEKYYSLLGDKKLNDVYNITSWEKGDKTFDVFNSWYKDIDKVNVIDIKDLGNDNYEITVDVYENIINEGNKFDKFEPFDKGGYYLEGIKLYTRYITEKKIVEKDGVKKLETVKNIKTYTLPSIEAYENDKDFFHPQYSLSKEYGGEFINKKLANGKTFVFGDSRPHDGNYVIIIYGDKGDINNYYNWLGYFGNEFISKVGINVNDEDYFAGNDKEKDKIKGIFNNAPSDMLENILYR